MTGQPLVRLPPLMPASRPFFAAEHPLPFAHRGGATLWPENTLEAFRGALELGCTYLETDIHRTRDGELVVFHDQRLERTTDGFGRVRDHTLAELRRLDAGYRFSPDGESHPFRGKGLSIPTLAEVFALSPSVRVNVEMKQGGVGLPEALLAAVDRGGWQERILVASADDRLGGELRRLARGRVATSASVREALAFWLALRAGITRVLPIGYDALQVPVRHAGLPVVDERFVRAAHRRGLEVHVWTVDEPDEMRRLLALGVDGLMSDRPDLLMDVVRERRSRD